MTTIIALTMIAFATWLPNLHLITRTMTSSTMTIWEKTSLLTALLGSLETNFTPLSKILIIISSTLSGIQGSLLIYYLRQAVRIQTETGISIAGIAMSLLGVGCTSCGSVILTSIIGFGSTTTVLGILPFKGQELGFVGIIILLAAIYYTLKKINQPFACVVKKYQNKYGISR